MKMTKQTMMVSTVLTLAAVSAWAIDSTTDFRTLAYGLGIYQSHNAANKPVYATQALAGHDLVAAALGQPLGTVLSNQVLALQVDCASTVASLVVYDKVLSNNVATIATSASFDVVQQQDRDLMPSPNRERFVAQFVVNPTQNLLGGYLTVAGRLHLDPTNGCPSALRIAFDPLDRYCADSDNQALDDRKDHDIKRAGLGHAMGVLSLVFNDGKTNTVLLPYMGLSIRRDLP